MRNSMFIISTKKEWEKQDFLNLLADMPTNRSKKIYIGKLLKQHIEQLADFEKAILGNPPMLQGELIFRTDIARAKRELLTIFLIREEMK